MADHEPTPLRSGPDGVPEAGSCGEEWLFKLHGDQRQSLARTLQPKNPPDAAEECADPADGGRGWPRFGGDGI